MAQSARYITDKRIRGGRVTLANTPREHELRFGAEANPQPHIACVRILCGNLRSDVLLLARDERPHLVELHALRGDIPHT
jgi:hypothetical protein